MCGICGVVAPATDERAVSVRRMASALEHRGPDAEGFFEDSTVALGMRRLSIIDVERGIQPIFDESRNVVAVFNGEIYNFRELRERLSARGHKFASGADSEVIPHLYEEYGAGFASELRGMFGIALWDRAAQIMVLVRDRLGKKPLYYAEVDDGVVFGSELKAILQDQRIRREPSKLAVSQYLTYQYVPAPLSAIDGVRKLDPGHYAVWKAGRLQTYPYWSLSYVAEPDALHRDPALLAEELRERIKECVKVRMVSERPLGAFLSGGLDSSAIVAAMNEVSSNTVRTFSIGFDEDSHNELPYARRVSARYATEHHEMVVRPDAVDLLPRLARSFDEPFADASAIPSYYLAEMTRQHVVVALNGDGGDEAFGGYLRYPLFLKAESTPVPRSLRLAIAAAQRVPKFATTPRFRRRLASANTILRGSTAAERYGRYVSYFRPEEKLQLLDAQFRIEAADEAPYERIEELWRRYANTDPVNRLLAIDTHTYLPGDLLPKVDITSMAVSLEARSPLLDHTLLEWAAQLPGSLKVKDGTTKRLLKIALKPWLDDDLIHRRKTGFGVPLGVWFRGPLREMVFDLLTGTTIRSRGWFSDTGVSGLLKRHMAGEDWSPQIYALLMLELWQREVLDAHAPAGR